MGAAGRARESSFIVGCLSVSADQRPQQKTFMHVKPVYAMYKF